ncbi:MAG: IS5 family transposase [Gammaproteobacteria bacterium]
MRQQSLAEEGFEKYRKPTRRERFLGEMEQIIPWGELSAVIEPFYPQPAGAGRRPIGIERMLRIHFLQHWFNLSDPAVEEALYDSRALRRFVGIDLGREAVPDETTILKFRHLLEAHNLGERLFELIGAYLQENGLAIGTGTIVDATLISAPSSTKNEAKARDPQMHQTKKGNQWYFGMKTHIGVDSKTKLMHSVVATAANVHDSQVLDDLLHGEERRVWGDSVYTGQRLYEHRARRNHPLSEADKAANRTKSKVRAKVEHPFHTLKCVFGFRKVRRGLDKNAERLFVACGLVNLYLARRRLLAIP